MTAHEELLRRAREIDAPQLKKEIEPEPSPDSESGETSPTMGSSLGTFIKENPGPSLLMGAGLAWLLVNRERERSRSLPTRIKDHALSATQTTKESLVDAKATAADKMESAREATSSKLESATQTASSKLDSAKQSIEKGRGAIQQRYRTMLDENPLALGACALAAGLAIGLLIPSTPKENELLGEASDSLMDQARGIVNEARRAAISTLRSSKDEVQEKLVDAKEEAKGALKESVESAKQAFHDEVQEES